MKTESQFISQSAANAEAALPLRQDDPLSLLFFFKTLGALALLLIMTYLALRWYAARHKRGVGAVSQKKMQCVQEMRLSVKTSAYLLDVEGQKFLVVDTNSGVSIVKVDPGTGIGAE